MIDRTDAQHMADIAATTLANLTKLDYDLGNLYIQLRFLSDWAAKHQPDMHHPDRPAVLHHEFLGHAAFVFRESAYLGCVPDMVRDIAATLPIRGLDYGDEINR